MAIIRFVGITASLPLECRVEKRRIFFSLPPTKIFTEAPDTGSKSSKVSFTRVILKQTLNQKRLKPLKANFDYSPYMDSTHALLG